MTKTLNFIQYLFALAIIASLTLWFLSNTLKANASVAFGNDYMATSTAANGVFGGFTQAEQLIKTGQGSLGSVVITGANTGVVNLYNATTSNVNLRSSGKATSTLLIASFPANTTVGNYVLDAVFTDGLLLSLPSGTMPTTTITYR